MNRQDRQNKQNTHGVLKVVADGGGYAAVFAFNRERPVAHGALVESSVRFELAPGAYYVSVTQRDAFGAIESPIDVAPNGRIAVTVQPSPAARLAGVVVGLDGKPRAGALVKVRPLYPPQLDFYVRCDPDGRFVAAPPASNFYSVAAEGDLFSEHVLVERGDRAAPIIVRARPRRSLIEALSRREVEQLRSSAIPLRSVAPIETSADLKALAPTFAEAHIVGLGEITHGTREFFQVKHRLFKYLVEEHGFRTLAVEGSFAGSLTVEDYVQGGEGDADSVLADMKFWTLDTEEVVALVKWMREYNAEKAPKDRVHFFGMDIQKPEVAIARLDRFFKRGGINGSSGFEEIRELFREGSASFRALSDHEKRNFLNRLAAFVAFFDTEREELRESVSERDWKIGRQLAVMLFQNASLYSDAREPGWTVRDRLMAENVKWLMDLDDTKLAVWAHDGHVSRGLYEKLPTVGSILGGDFKERYVSLGFVFNRGGFQARDGLPRDETMGVREFKVGEAPEGYLGRELAKAGLASFVLDLRRLPRGPLRRWLGKPRFRRGQGSVYIIDSEEPIVLPEEFDIVVFIEETTRARPTRTGRRGPGQ